MPTDLFAKGLPETLKRSLKEHRQQVSAILKQLAMKDTYNLKSASNLNGNLNCSKELEHYAS